MGLVDDSGSAEPLHGLVLRSPSDDQVGQRTRRQAGADCLCQLLRRAELHVRVMKYDFLSKGKSYVERCVSKAQIKTHQQEMPTSFGRSWLRFVT